MIIIFFIFGLIIGSFLNAVVYRINQVESLLERSHCPNCKKKVRWFDNIPVLSFIALGARCRDCGEKISWQYPIVEFFCGIIFALIGKYFFVFYDFQSWMQTAFYLAIFAILLIIFVYDFKYMEIPMIAIWIGIGISIIYALSVDWNIFANASSLIELKTISGLIGGFVAFGFFFSLAFYSKEQWMGYGDAYLGILVGLIVGWPNIIGTLMISFIIGATISVMLIAVRKKTMKSQVPFAPFLAVGTFLMVILPEIFPELKYLLFYF